MPNTSSIYIQKSSLDSLEARTKIFSEYYYSFNVRADEEEANQFDRVRLEFEDKDSGIQFSEGLCIYEFDFELSKERIAMTTMLDDLGVEYAS